MENEKCRIETKKSQRAIFFCLATSHFLLAAVPGYTWCKAMRGPSDFSSA